jgi:hypothetical protein
MHYVTFHYILQHYITLHDLTSASISCISSCSASVDSMDSIACDRTPRAIVGRRREEDRGARSRVMRAVSLPSTTQPCLSIASNDDAGPRRDLGDGRE